MRKLLGLLFICCLAASGGVIILNPVSTGAGTSFVAGFAKEYRFDDGSDDTLTEYVAAANGQLGASAGADASDPDWVTAGLDFPGATDRVVNMTAFIDPNSGAFSVFIVAEMAADSTRRAMISQEDGSGTGRTWAEVHTDNTYCTVLGSAQQCRSGAVGAGWHMFGMVYNGSGTITLYLDGGTDATNLTATPESATGNMRFGVNKAASPGTPWSTEMGYVLFYSSALNSSEVTQNYNHFDTIMTARSVSLP